MSGKTILIENRLKKYVDSEMDFAFETSEADEKTDIEKFKIEELNSFTYQDLRETVNILCDLTFKTFFICYGILQFFAILSGLLRIFHHDGICILLISSILAFLPIIGSILGVWGACTSWGWNVWASIFVFAIPYIIVNGPLLMITFFETYKDLKRWQSEKTFKTPSIRVMHEH
jgi:hypothetical protein